MMTERIGGIGGGIVTGHGCRYVGCRLSGERAQECLVAGLAARRYPRQPTTDNRQLLLRLPPPSFIVRAVPSTHSTNELLRKSIHIAFGVCAFALKFLPWTVAAAVCVVAILGNFLVLHRVVGRGVARHERGYDAGIVLYPVAVLLLVLVFRDRQIGRAHV